MEVSGRTILRADALYLVGASAGAFLAGLLGAPVAGIGFGGAHELAVIAGLLAWPAAPRRIWHLAMAAVHALFGAANLAYWPAVASAGIEAAGVFTMAMHLLFVMLQLSAAAAVNADAPEAERALPPAADSAAVRR